MKVSHQVTLRVQLVELFVLSVGSRRWELTSPLSS